MKTVLLVPGPLDSVSGGYFYDHHMIAGLRALGHEATAVALAGTHPLADEAARAAALAAWRALPAGAVPVIDGLGLPAFAAVEEELGRAVGLIHHPTALEPGHDEAVREALRALERKLMPRLRHVVVTSPTTAERLAADFGVPAERISVVVPGTAATPRAEGSGGPTCEILSVGTLVPRKGHDVLLRALARLFDLDWRLTIVGGARDAAHAAALRDLVDELGIGLRVSFAGELLGAALAAQWQRAEIFALATRYEGYGMAIAEALRHGVPVAVTSGGAAGALVTPACGVVCEPDDVVTLSKSLRRMIFDTALRRDMAEAAWQVGQILPDWPDQARLFAGALA
ncbi:MAG: glycosyltransferase family 4 protein [Rhodospirillales bacterium]|nr:glycosyltransferase family 4 protein [Rhodospirillales bacterium]